MIPTIERMGLTTMLITWENRTIDRYLLQEITSIIHQIFDSSISGVVDCNAGYNSIAVSYLPSMITFEMLAKEVRKIVASEATDINQFQPKVWTIKVDYHNAPDLERLEKATSLSRTEIIAIHTSQIYDVHFIGFLPGFLYLGGLSEKLHVERLSTPRLKVPRGSVGIGGSQTGIYPTASPGGWHIIGHTNFVLFDPTSENPMKIKAGDKVQFQSIHS